MDKLVTIERHILNQEHEHPEATGILSSLLYDIALAAKIIARETMRAGLTQILGMAGWQSWRRRKPTGSYRSNQGNEHFWSAGMRRFTDWLQGVNPDEPSEALAARYVGSLVADFHRNVLAGGCASDGTRPILNIQPVDLHQRAPLLIGNRSLVLKAEECLIKQ